MGRKQKQPYESVKVATGIEARYWPNSSSLRVIFWYKGIECRETLKIEATNPNVTYAKRLRSEILNQIARGTFSYADYFPDSNRARQFGHVSTNKTVGELLTEYLEQVKDTVELSTYDGYRKVTHTHLLPEFGKIAVRDFKPAHIRQWIRKLTIKRKTITNILIPLRNVLDQAVTDDLITSNPLNRVIIDKVASKNTRDSDYEPDPFDKLEIEAILANAEGQAKNLFQFAFFTGLRTSELIALEWDDIDWIKGLVRVRRAVVKKQVKTTKTRAGLRDVMLLPPALAALKAQKSHTYMKSKRVFHNPRTDSPWETDGQIRKTCWTYILRKAEVRYRNPYQTRHTFASMMLSAGESILWLAKQMGHKNTKMIIEVYAKWLPQPNTESGYKPVNDWSAAVKVA